MARLNQQSNASILGLMLWCNMFIACQDTGERKDAPAKRETKREVVTIKKQPRITWPSKKQQIQDSLSLCTSWADSLICLNRFAHRDLSHGPSSLLVDSIVPDTVNRLWNCEQWYYYILRDSVTVYCTGHTQFYSKLITEFLGGDFVPHKLSIGTQDSKEGHTMCLVLVKRSSTVNMYLIDPMFNSAYTLASGELADYRHLIYLARMKAYHLYNILSMRDAAPYLLQSEQNITLENATFDASQDYYLEKSHNPNFPLKLRAKRTIDHYLSVKFEATYQRIAAYHGQKSLQFKSAQDFKKCVLFRSALFGPNTDILHEELSSFEHDDLQELDAMFSNYGLSVNQLNQSDQ